MRISHKLTVFSLTLGLLCPAISAQAGPSFDCKSASKKVEKMICTDKLLSALDLKLASVYQKAKKENPSDKSVSETQIAWIKDRNSCENDPEVYDCIKRKYALRLSYLQARYKMAPVAETSNYKCTSINMGDQPKVISVHAMSYETVIPSVTMKAADTTHVAFLGRIDGALRYAGEGVSLYREDGGSRIKLGGDIYSCEAY